MPAVIDCLCMRNLESEHENWSGQNWTGRTTCYGHVLPQCHITVRISIYAQYFEICLLTLLQLPLVQCLIMFALMYLVLLFLFQRSRTPLYGASLFGHLHTVRLLLQRGAVVDSRSEVRQSQCITDVEYAPLRMSIIFHHCMIEVFRYAVNM